MQNQHYGGAGKIRAVCSPGGVAWGDGILKYQNGRWVETASCLDRRHLSRVFERFEFANVDRQLVLRWGQKRLAFDLTGDEDLPIGRLQQGVPAGSPDRYRAAGGA